MFFDRGDIEHALIVSLDSLKKESKHYNYSPLSLKAEAVSAIDLSEAAGCSLLSILSFLESLSRLAQSSLRMGRFWLGTAPFFRWGLMVKLAVEMIGQLIVWQRCLKLLKTIPKSKDYYKKSCKKCFVKFSRDRYWTGQQNYNKRFILNCWYRS